MEFLGFLFVIAIAGVIGYAVYNAYNEGEVESPFDFFDKDK